MEIILKRKYYPGGTNGIIYINGNLQCYSIELPWLDNQHAISCIPEGFYDLSICFTERLGEHLRVEYVPGRFGILMHAANDALHQLKGCIATVSKLTGEGKGENSKKALADLIKKIKAAPNQKIILNIQKDTL